jgi:hypothetical protein
MSNSDDSWALGHIWPSKAAMARDIGQPVGTVGPWFSKGRRIPPARFGQIIAAARRNGVELDWESLEAINADAAEAVDDTTNEAAA